MPPANSDETDILIVRNNASVINTLYGVKVAPTIRSVVKEMKHAITGLVYKNVAKLPRMTVLWYIIRISCLCLKLKKKIKMFIYSFKKLKYIKSGQINLISGSTDFVRSKKGNIPRYQNKRKPGIELEMQGL